MKAILPRATNRQKRPLLIVKEGSKTTPNLTLSISKIIERSQMGMEIQSNQAIYLGPQNDEFSEFDQLDKLEKIDRIREYSKKADENLTKTKKEIAEAQKKQKEEENRQYRESVKVQVLEEIKAEKKL